MSELVETRVCKACKEELPVSNFYFRKEKGDYRGCCKKCKRIKTKEEIIKQAIAETKVCKHCGVEKSKDEFNKSGGGKWCQPYCKPCDTIRKRKHTEENIDYVKQKRSKYYIENAEIIAEKTKERYKDKKDVISVKAKEYRTRNSEKVKERHRNYQQQNKDKIIKYRKERYLKNKEEHGRKAKIYRDSMTPEQKAAKKEYNRLYKLNNKEKLEANRIKNKDKRRERNRIYNNKKASTDISFKILKNLRGRVRFALKKWETVKSDTTENLLGCTIPEFKEYFSSLFTGNMSWDAFMNGEIHIDHIFPCSSFDLRLESEQRKCFHYTNLQPLWWIDNLKKGVSIPESKQLQYG